MNRLTPEDAGEAEVRDLAPPVATPKVVKGLANLGRILPRPHLPNNQLAITAVTEYHRKIVLVPGPWPTEVDGRTSCRSRLLVCLSRVVNCFILDSPHTGTPSLINPDTPHRTQ
jgi:hypothetical protein